MTTPNAAPARFTLQRLDHTERATFGQLFDAEGKQICVTLELPWKYNAKSISCIPPGTYRAYRRKSPKRGYWLYELIAVPGRSHIEIHIGNTTADSEGCILVGTRHGEINGVKGILESRPAVSKWMEATRRAEFITIEVKAPPVSDIASSNPS